MCEKMDLLLRNIELRPIDFKNDVLSEEFFKREDVSEEKKKLLKELNEKLKNN